MSSMCGASPPPHCGAAIKDRDGEWHKCHGFVSHRSDHWHCCEDGTVYKWRLLIGEPERWVTLNEVVSHHWGGKLGKVPA